MAEKRLNITVPEELGGRRLDQALSALLPDYSRSLLQKLIADGRLSIGGSVIDLPRFKVKEGMEITLAVPDFFVNTALPDAEPFAFPILYEDAEMLIINKPPGVVVHPGAGVVKGTVVNALLSRYPDLRVELRNENLRPGIVHRLDKDTSGCLAAAKNIQAQAKLSAEFADRRTEKVYLALLFGHFAEKRGHIENNITRHPVDRQRMTVSKDSRRGKVAVSDYKIVSEGFLGSIPVSLAEVKIFTGRTHQIRVHMANLNHPVIGDLTYGHTRVMLAGVQRQMLHAWKLALNGVSVSAPLPEDFQQTIDRISEEPQR